MKHLRKILSLCLILLMLVFFVSAHPGGTDANGGHYNRSTGEYHYHHGHEAHQHTGGVCPFNFVDATVNTRSSASNKDTKEPTNNITSVPSPSTPTHPLQDQPEQNTQKSKLSAWDIFFIIVLGAPFAFFLLCALAMPIVFPIWMKREQRNDKPPRHTPGR